MLLVALCSCKLPRLDVNNQILISNISNQIYQIDDVLSVFLFNLRFWHCSHLCLHISAVSSGRYPLNSDYFTVLPSTRHQFFLNLLNSRALQLNASHQIEWKASLASPDVQPSPPAFSISVTNMPKAKRSPFQLIS